MEKDSRMTIEDLALLMERRFTEIEQKFDQTFDEKFALVLTKKDGIAMEMQLEAKIDEKLDTFATIVAKGFAHMDEKFDTLKEDMDIKFEEVHENLGKVRNDILNLGDRFITHSEFNQFKLRLKSK